MWPLHVRVSIAIYYQLYKLHKLPVTALIEQDHFLYLSSLLLLLSSNELYLSHTEYTKYNQQWNVFSAFNPSKCTHTWSSGQPTLWHPGSSGVQCLAQGSQISCGQFLPEPRFERTTSGYKSDALSIRATTADFNGLSTSVEMHLNCLIFFNLYQKSFESRWLSREKWITLVLCCDWLLVADVTYSCSRTPLTQDQAWVDRESW